MPWKPGQSGNPAGRRPETIIEVREVRRLSREWSTEAAKKIYLLMGAANKDSVKLAAAIAILRMAGVSFASALEEARAEAEARSATTPSEIDATLQPPALPLN